MAADFGSKVAGGGYISIDGVERISLLQGGIVQFDKPAVTKPLAQASLTVDLSAKQDFILTPTANGTLTFSNLIAGAGIKGDLILVNANNYVISKHTSVKCPSSMLAAISNSGTYRISYVSLDGVSIFVTASQALS